MSRIELYRKRWFSISVLKDGSRIGGKFSFHVLYLTPTSHLHLSLSHSQNPPPPSHQCCCRQHRNNLQILQQLQQQQQRRRQFMWIVDPTHILDKTRHELHRIKLISWLPSFCLVLFLFISHEEKRYLMSFFSLWWSL